jgi:capsular polysaccharide biosynthesis protein
MTVGDPCARLPFLALSKATAGIPPGARVGGQVEIDEVAARLLRQYWAVLLVCLVAPLIAISYLTAKQPAMYAASARIITGNEVPQTSAAADAVANQVQAIATGRSAVTQALQAAGAKRNLSNFISNNIAVSGLGSSQVIDLTVTDRSPQVAQQVARVLSAGVVRSINNVGQSGLRAALAANDHEIVRLSQQRADLAARAAAQPQNQQFQAELAGLDEVIANFTGDRSRLLIQAGTLGLATVIDEPALPARPESKASAQKLGLAALLGLAAGILIVSVAEILRPTVPGARRVSRRLGVPTLGQLSKQDLTGARTPAVADMALRLRLVAAHAGLRSIALVDVDGKRELGPLTAALTQSLRLFAADGALGQAGLDGGTTGNPHWTGTAAGASASTGPGLLVKPHGLATENATLHIYPLAQMKRVAENAHVGIVVLSGPVARVSLITALHDLAESSGWPIVGVIGVPRMRRWRARRAVRATGPADDAVHPAGHGAEGSGQ